VARPRRFYRVIRIDLPDPEARHLYLAAKLGADDAELERWVALTDGLSRAACAEAVISVRCLGHALELLRKPGRGRGPAGSPWQASGSGERVSLAPLLPGG